MLAIGSAAYASDQVTVTWSDPQPATGTTQYIVTAYCRSVPYFGNNSQPVAVGQPTTVQFNPGQPDPLNPADSYYLEAAAYDDDGNLLARSAAVALLAFPPEDLRYQVQGAALSARWTALTTEGVTGYTAQLLKGGQLVESQDPTAPGVAFATALEPDAAYQVQVRARGAATTGPWSVAQYAPLVLASADCDAGLVAVAWSDPQPAPGTAQYIVTVYCATEPAFGNNSPPVLAGQPLTVAFNPAQPDPLVPGKDYYLEVGSYDADGDLLTRSGPVTLLAWPPAAVELYWDGAKLTASWTGPGTAGVTGYTAQLLADGQAQETAEAAASPAPFQTSFGAGVLYQARVRAVGNKTKGPWSAAATGPYKTVLSYTFDALGRLGGCAADGNTRIDYAYDDRGNILTASVTVGT